MWTSFHWSWCICNAIRSTIFHRCSRNIFTSVFMNTPTVANRSIALNTLISSICCTIRNVTSLATVLIYCIIILYPIMCSIYLITLVSKIYAPNMKIAGSKESWFWHQIFFEPKCFKIKYSHVSGWQKVSFCCGLPNVLFVHLTQQLCLPSNRIPFLFLEVQDQFQLFLDELLNVKSRKTIKIFQLLQVMFRIYSIKYWFYEDDNFIILH